MRDLPRSRLFSGARVRTGSIVALVLLFPAGALAVSSLSGGDAKPASPTAATGSAPAKTPANADPNGPVNLT